MRRPGGVSKVKGNTLRDLRELVRFSDVPYSEIAAMPEFGYKTGMGVLKAARRYERENGIGEKDPSPPPTKEQGGDVRNLDIKIGDFSGASQAAKAEAEE